MSSGTSAGSPGLSGATAPRPDQQELLYLRQFFYQCPVGLFEIDDAGTVQMVNPAAVRMLAPVIGGGGLAELFPLLRQIAPRMVDVIAADPDVMGPLAVGQRVLIPAGADRDAFLEMQAVRVAAGRVMILLQDVSAEQRLALREHRMAVELQLAMLGHADEVFGLPSGVTYRAAAAELQVGGDWYDIVDLGDGRAELVVGDVVGHNLAATTAMGQLRSGIRATARYRPDPAALLREADRMAGQIGGAECSTVACALLDLGSGALSYSCAGHPPVLIAHAGRPAEFLDGGRGVPLGVADLPRASGTYQLTAGDIVIMYTDGLYERRTGSVNERLARLAELATQFRRLPPTELSQALTEGMLDGAEPEDDICVLVAAPPVNRR